MMKFLKGNKAVVIHSLVWAAMMLVTAWLSGDAANVNQLIIFMVGGWFISQQLLLDASKGKTHSCQK